LRPLRLRDDGLFEGCCPPVGVVDDAHAGEQPGLGLGPRRSNDATAGISSRVAITVTSGRRTTSHTTGQ
jgi:hypothetical protein